MKTVQKIFLLSLLLTSFLAAARSPSEWIDVTQYRFTVTLNDSTDIIEGSAVVEFIARKNLRDFALDLIQGGGQHGMKVSGVTWKGAALKYAQRNDKLHVFLGGEITAGASSGITIRYSGIPKDGLIISENKFGDRTFFADNWPDRGRNWLPVVDHPADKAAVEFIVLAPPHYEVIANGIRTEESYLNPKQKLTRYEHNTPISTKVMVIGVARFAFQQAGMAGQIPVETWVYPQNREAGFYDFMPAVDILSYFSRRIGPYPYGKLANVQSKTIFGGLENASAIFYAEDVVTGQAAPEGLIAHEVAHQWFGNSATEKEWQHLWLSEGFATYFSLLYIEHRHGVALRREKMKEDRDKVTAYFKAHPSSSVVDAHLEDPMDMLNANAYQKGSWVLHMLRADVGDSAFWQGIRDYYSQFRDSVALTGDFRKAMEDASGKDLGPFFRQWIYRGGHPVLEWQWTYNSAKKTADLVLKQVQEGELFDFQLEIAVYGDAEGERRFQKVHISRAAHEFAIPAPSGAVKVELDPDINLLFEAKMRN